MYQKQLDVILNRIRDDRVRPSLLLHVCCAPCSSYVLEYLIPYFSITVFYYNPNIAPESEFVCRLEEEKRLLAELPGASGISVVAPPYDHDEFLRAARGLEDEPERGLRCRECFRLRLGAAARYAADHGYDWYTTTLSISPLKNAALLNEIGGAEGERCGVAFLPSDFKKRDGYKRSIELSRQYSLYRQDFCGCEFSRAERDRARQQKEQIPERKMQ